MSSVLYHVDVFLPGGQIASRTQVMDMAEARAVAEFYIRDGYAKVNIVGLDSTGSFTVATYEPASVPSLHTRPSKD